MSTKKEEAVKTVGQMINSPIFFVEKMWGLTPQVLICEIQHEHKLKCYETFQKGKHVTWQQVLILRGVEKALAGQAPKRLAVASGHGIGKDALLSWLIHWYLFTRIDSQIGCTAPTATQLYDVLWKELSVWHHKLSEDYRRFFLWTASHYKIVERPETWWARARTASKETPEAFAGLHGESVMLIGDEASGIPDEIFRTGEGSLTDKDTLVVLVGNPIRLDGFFYDCFNKDKNNWQVFNFDSRESPIVEPDYIGRIIAKYGEDSDEFAFMVAGQFPKQQGIDKGGWMPLLSESDLRFCPDTGYFRQPRLGIDPAGEGNNKSAFVLRDSFKAKLACIEDISTPKTIAEKALTIMTHYNILAPKVSIDNFGAGANVGAEIAISVGQRVHCLNVGEKADNDKFINKRAECYWRLREWIIAGGLLTGNLENWKELFTLRYKRTLMGKIQIMSKVEMKDKYGFESPDVADALSLTFTQKDSIRTETHQTLSSSEIADLTNIY